MNIIFLFSLLFFIFKPASLAYDLPKLQLKQNSAGSTDKKNYKGQRNTDIVNLNSTPFYNNYKITIDQYTSVYPIISSHNTGFSNGNCPLFKGYSCVSPSCVEDVSIFES